MILIMFIYEMLYGTENDEKMVTFTYKKPEAPLVRPLFFSEEIQDKDEEAVNCWMGLLVGFHEKNKRNIQVLTEAGFFQQNGYSNLTEKEYKALKAIIQNTRSQLIWYCQPHLKHGQDREMLYKDFMQFYHFCFVEKQANNDTFRAFPYKYLNEFYSLFTYYYQHGIPK